MSGRWFPIVRSAEKHFQDTQSAFSTSTLCTGRLCRLSARSMVVTKVLLQRGIKRSTSELNTTTFPSPAPWRTVPRTSPPRPIAQPMSGWCTSNTGHMSAPILSAEYRSPGSLPWNTTKGRCMESLNLAALCKDAIVSSTWVGSWLCM